jgi:site-specific DNA recombinase
MTMTEKRAAIYCRVSSPKQAKEERHSLSDQEVVCRSVAEKHDLKVLFVEDMVVSASKLSASRPGLAKILAMAEAGELDALVVWRANRLARNVKVGAAFEALWEIRPDFEIYDKRGLMRKNEVLRQMIDAKEEIEEATEDRMRGRKSSLASGKLPGGSVPYGYGRDDENRPTIIEKEAEAVQKIFLWYAESISKTKIGARLEREGFLPRHNLKKWARGTISGILREAEFYADGMKLYKLGDETYPIEFPSIISSALYDGYIQMRESHKVQYGGWLHSYQYHLLRGLVTDACGWRWVVRTDKRWPRNNRYMCVVRDHGIERHKNCGISYRMKDLDEYVWNYVAMLMLNREELEKVIGQQLKELQKDVEGVSKEITGIEKRLEKLEAERAWIISNARINLLSTDDLEHQLAEVTLATNGMEAKREKLRKQRALAKGEIDEAEVIFRAFADEVSNFAYASVDLSDVTGELPDILPVVLYGPHEDGVATFSPVVEGEEMAGKLFLPTNVVYEKLGAAAFAEDVDGDKVEALRKAKYTAQRGILKRFIRRVVVSQDGDEKTVQIELRLPSSVESLSISLPSTISVPRGR